MMNRDQSTSSGGASPMPLSRTLLRMRNSVRRRLASAPPGKRMRYACVVSAGLRTMTPTAPAGSVIDVSAISTSATATIRVPGGTMSCMTSESTTNGRRILLTYHRGGFRNEVSHRNSAGCCLRAGCPVHGVGEEHEARQVGADVRNVGRPDGGSSVHDEQVRHARRGGVERAAEGAGKQ